MFRDYVAWDTERYRDVLDEAYFDTASLEAEIAGLPGEYAPPKGSLLLALLGQIPAGCCGLRDLGEGYCEMKHLFVARDFGRRGIGRALVRQTVAEATTAGYRYMRLETGVRNSEAMLLYQRLGFLRIDPYYPIDEKWRHLHVFFELPLPAVQSRVSP
jgi:ribosomal protein S18 acetylase RimI-like enzyme